MGLGIAPYALQRTMTDPMNAALADTPGVHWQHVYLDDIVVECDEPAKYWRQYKTFT